MEFRKVFPRSHAIGENGIMQYIWYPMLIISLTGLMGCGTPEELRTDGIPAVSPLDLDRYQGTWYEIMRLPNRFEEGLEQITANYTITDDGDLQVVNRGYNPETEEWEEADGKAWLPDPGTPGLLKVSFFWFFSSDYKVIALDQENYSYAMVTSSSKKYLWILSRSRQLDNGILRMLIDKAKGYGFAVEELIRVDQS